MYNAHDTTMSPEKVRKYPKIAETKSVLLLVIFLIVSAAFVGLTSLGKTKSSEKGAINPISRIVSPAMRAAVRREIEVLLFVIRFILSV